MAVQYTVSWDGGSAATSGQLVSDDPTCTITNLAPNTAYTITVYAMNEVGQSENSVPIVLTTSVLSVPGVPVTSTIQSLSTTATSLSCVWAIVENATSYPYLLEYMGTIAEGIAEVNAINFTGLTPSTTYALSLASRNDAGTSAYCTPKSLTTLATSIPSVPTGLAFIDKESDGFTMSWNLVVGATNYTLDWGFVPTHTGNTNTYKIINLEPNTSYTVKILASNAYGNSAYSSTITAYTLTLPPYGLTVDAVGNTTVSLSWTPINNNGFGVYWGETAVGTFPNNASVAPDTYEYEVTGLTTGIEYSFCVAGINGDDDASRRSSIVEAIPFEVPDIPGTNLVFWLDASDDSTLTYSSGTTVATWTDKKSSVVGSTFGGGTQTIVADIFNGLQAVKFSNNDGGCINFGNNINITTNGQTIFIVIMVQDVESPNNVGYVSKAALVNPQTSGAYAIIDGGDGYRTISFVADNTGGQYIYTDNADTALKCLTSKFPYNTGTSGLYLNNNLLLTGNSYETFAVNNDYLFIGAFQDETGQAISSSTTLEGYVCEVLIYNGVLSSLQQSSVYDYLQEKWGIGATAAPTSLTYATNPLTIVEGLPMTPNNPSNSGGMITNYSVEPALVAGMSLNTTTGVISGTPSATETSITHTITGVNSGGSTTCDLVITVDVPSPPTGLIYATNPLFLTLGAPMTPDPCTNSGGVITLYTVAPDLVTGMSIDPVTGIVSGTPTVTESSVTHVVTGSNAGGATNCNLVVSVTLA